MKENNEILKKVRKYKNKKHHYTFYCLFNIASNEKIKSEKKKNEMIMKSRKQKNNNNNKKRKILENIF